MTVGVASSLANSILDTNFPNTTYAKTHTGDPGSAGTANAGAGDTTRKVCTWASAASGSKALSANVGPWTNGGITETVSHGSLWTALSAGTFIASFALAASQAWVSTNTLTLTGLTITVTPLAA